MVKNIPIQYRKGVDIIDLEDLGYVDNPFFKYDINSDLFSKL